MRVLRRVNGSVLCLVIAACGAPSPIELRVPIQQPACFSENVVTATDAASQILSGARSFVDIGFLDAVARAQVLVEPVRRDPTASSWHLPAQNGAMEGSVLARGDGWAVIEMSLIVTGAVVEGTIHVFPDRLGLASGDDNLEIRENVIRLNQFVRGCDPMTQTMFEVGPGLVDGKVDMNVHTCWWSGGAATHSPAITTSSTTNVFEAAYEEQCLELITYVLAQP
jgi:hypothetical protein